MSPDSPPTPAAPPAVSSPRLVVLAAALLAVAVGLFTAIGSRRPDATHEWGDEGTYLAMTASLVRDGDLTFEEADAEWARSRPHRPATVILQRTDSGIAYSKPVLYPLLASPLFALFGERGLVALNVLAVLVATFLGWVLLRRIAEPGAAALTLASFLALSTTIPYLTWRMSESLQLALSLSGLVLCLGAIRSPAASRSRFAGILESGWAPPLGGALLALLVSTRTPHLLILVAAVAALVAAGSHRRALSTTAAAIVTLGFLALVSVVTVDSLSPYTEARSSFNEETGYPAGPGASEVAARFDERPATHRPTRRQLQIDKVAYSSLYTAIGRHTGIVLYFPAALALCLFGLFRGDRTSAAVLAGAVLLLLFYLYWMPENYFGGSTFLGNRYFVAGYPLLLLALARAPGVGVWLATWALGLAIGGSAFVSVDRTATFDSSSQSHAAAGVFRLFPYESTAIAVGTHQSRFWSRDYLRFVDAYAEIGERSFRVQANRPAPEVLVATHRTEGPMHFVIESEEPARIEISDWAGSSTYDLESGASVLAFEPSTAWRQHRFSWNVEQRYLARTLRFDLLAEDASQDVSIRYLGDGSALEHRFGRRFPGVKVSDRAAAGSSSRIHVHVRNMSGGPWSSDGILPVQLRYWLRDIESGERIEGPSIALPGTVRRGTVLRTDIDVRWPDRAGTWEILIDLELDPVGRFSDFGGRPLARQVVSVE